MKRLLIAFVGLLPLTSAAYGEENKDIRVRVGLGAQIRPDFVGSDKSEIAPLWDFDLARGANEFIFEAPDDSFGFGVVSSGRFSAGPAVKIESRRDDSDLGVSLGRVPATIEAGAFVQYDASPTLRFRAEARKGLGGHRGIVGALGVDRIWRDGDKYVFSIGPRVLVSDARYQRAYFEVTPAAAIASGLPAYRPSGGVNGVALTSGLSYQFNPRFGMFGFARYERLIGDAAKSPIIGTLGSRNQLSAGIGLAYTFTVHR